jgi:uncharacterized membrane protein YgdD (TMEM256/DUF423 family)
LHVKPQLEILFWLEEPRRLCRAIKRFARLALQINTGPMSQAQATRIAAATGFLAVGLGAFGAHGLKSVFAQNGMAHVWETAVFYHFIHVVMLFVLAERTPFRAVVWWSFLIGILLFSGSLYLLAATNVHWLGVITPFGGVSFLVGWGCLILKSSRA